jgi:copper chaperone NosL
MFFKLFLLFIITTFLYSYPTYSTVVKEKKIYPMGEKVYLKLCSEIKPEDYSSYDEMQKEIISKKLCKNLNDRYLEVLSLYLWDVKRNNLKEKKYEKLTVTQDEKCPVCGMFLYKYPMWVCKIKYSKNSVAFDGIKDMMKYYFEHLDQSAEMLVQEYYTANTINAREAYFVTGSDVYGPMGNELIAFKDESSAKRFMLDHRAKEILRFDEITQEKVYKLDN